MVIICKWSQSNGQLIAFETHEGGAEEEEQELIQWSPFANAVDLTASDSVHVLVPRYR
jgi:hypothetical protein